MNEYLPVFKINEGDLFPQDIFVNELGEEIKLSDLNQKWIALFFYPQDDTPTCTKEACNLRDNFEILKEDSIAIFGISPDGEKSHQKFIKKFNLPYSLLIDEDHQLASKLGIWGTKKFMGQVYQGLHRVTVILNHELKVHKLIHPVDSGNHAEQIREFINT